MRNEWRDGAIGLKLVYRREVDILNTKCGADCDANSNNLDFLILMNVISVQINDMINLID